MSVVCNKNIKCPRCKADAIYKYGKTKSGRQKYMCVLCKKQFTYDTMQTMKRYLICNSCGSKMYVYMKDRDKKITRFRCSKYPKCKTYIIRREL